MGAKAIKLGSWDKHPATARIGMSCVALIHNGINVMEYFKPGE